MKSLFWYLLFLIILLLLVSIPTVLSIASRFKQTSALAAPRFNPNSTLSKETAIKLKNLDEEYSLCGMNKMDIRELTVAKVHKYFETGQLSSTELTLCYLQRIEQMNPILKAVIEVNPEATKIAIQSDIDRLNGISHSPLHGIPILIKDNIATFDLMQTTVGAIAMEFLKPKKDADVVRRLRAAGVVILGKSNPSEWAYFRGDDEPSGWSGRGGQTLSPYVLSENPSGSSTGSAVAVGANLAMMALGTETDGSIISPSSRGSIVGLKPTLGAVSTTGVIPISFSQDCVGPMARTSVDAAILMQIISNIKLDGCGYRLQTCLSHKKFNIGVLRDPLWNASDSIISASIPKLEASLTILEGTGRATIIDPVKGDSALMNNITSEAEFTVFTHEFKYGVNKYLSEMKHLESFVGRRIAKLSDIIQFNIANPPPEGYNQVNLIAAEATDGITNQTYKQIRLQIKQTAQKFLLNILNSNKLDAIVGPCDSDETWVLYSYGAIAGYPSISVPVGLSNSGMPFGICFLGKPNSESVLLKIAYLLETAAPMRKTPLFKS